MYKKRYSTCREFLTLVRERAKVPPVSSLNRLYSMNRITFLCWMKT